MAIIKIRQRNGNIALIEEDKGFTIHHGVEEVDGQWIGKESFHFETVEEAAQNYTTAVAHRTAKEIISTYYENRAK